MKTLYCTLLTSLLGCSTPVHYTYWEDVPENNKISIIEGSKLNKQISEIDELDDKYYPISVDEMMKQLTSSTINDSLLPFYFYTFNKWCMKADGAIGEIMGLYCMDMILNHPDYVLNYFQSHPDLADEYAFYIGGELSYSGNKAEFEYQKFCKKLKMRTKDFKRYSKTYNFFCASTHRWLEYILQL